MLETPLALLETHTLRMAKPLLEQRVTWIEAETPGFVQALKVLLGPSPAVPEQRGTLGVSDLRRMAEFLAVQCDERRALCWLSWSKVEERSMSIHVELNDVFAGRFSVIWGCATCMTPLEASL